MTNLEEANYDPVIHMRDILADSSSLSKLGELNERLDAYQTILQSEISKNIKEQRDFTKKWTNATSSDIQGNTPTTPVNKLKEELINILGQITSLEDKATGIEEIITGMTVEIKKLDNAKRNLTLSMTTLKRLQMLGTAYDQLRLLVQARQYKEISQLLAVVLELLRNFKLYRGIESISQLAKSVSEMEQSLSKQIMDDFEAAFSGKSPELFSAGSTTLADGCLVLDTINDDSKDRLIDWYCANQVKEYIQIFKAADEAGQLDNMPRRFAYIRKVLNSYLDQQAHFFPPSWNVGEILVAKFCAITKDNINTIFSKVNASSISSDVLLFSLKETLEFEQYLAKKFPSIKEKSKRNDGNIEKNSKNSKKIPNFEHAISSVFEPYLNIWVESHGKTLSGMISAYKTQPIIQHDDDKNLITVLSSSADLFFFYRRTLTQAAKLSTGAPLVSLAKLFSKWLQSYGTEVLLRNLPGNVDSEVEITKVGIIISTADYCFHTTDQLEDSLKTHTDEAYKAQINFDNEKDLFLSVINNGLRLLVKKVETKCSISWREMLNINWFSLKSVGDQSSYVYPLVKAIESSCEEIIPHLYKDLFIRSFCDKVVEYVVTTLEINLMKIRPISEIAAEQILLDLYVIRKSLQKLTVLVANNKRDSLPGEIKPHVSEQYVKHVQRALNRIETVLKVILTQATPKEGLITNYFFLIGDKSVNNFKKILELKGVNKNEYTAFFEMFKSHVTAHESLVEESPILTPLDFSTNSLTSSNSGQKVKSNQTSPNMSLNTSFFSSKQTSTSPFLGPASPSAFNNLPQMQSQSPSSIYHRLQSSIAGNNHTGRISSLTIPSQQSNSNVERTGRLSSELASTEKGDDNSQISIRKKGHARGNSFTNMSTGSLLSFGSRLEPSTIGSLASGVKEGVEKLTSPQTSAGIKLNENMRHFGRFFRREGSSSPNM